MALEVTLFEGKKIDQAIYLMARSFKAMDVKGTELIEKNGKITILCKDSDSEIAQGVVSSLDVVESIELRA